MAQRKAALECSEKSTGSKILLTQEREDDPARPTGKCPGLELRVLGCGLALVFISTVGERLHKIMFPVAHDQHRTGRVPDYPFGSAAQEQMFQAAVAMGGDDEQVNLQLPCDRHDFVKRAATANND